MGRKANSQNSSNYHYKITDLGTNQVEYYKTRLEICNKYNCTNRIITHYMKGNKSKKLNGLKIEKTNLPVYKKVQETY